MSKKSIFVLFVAFHVEHVNEKGKDTTKYVIIKAFVV